MALNGELNQKGVPYLSDKATVGSLVSQGKNILIYESFYGIFPNRTCSEELLDTPTIYKNHIMTEDKEKDFLVVNSYWQTCDKYAKRNFEKCKKWSEDLNDEEKYLQLIKSQPKN